MQYKVDYSIFRDNDLATEYCRGFLDGDSGCIVDQYSKYGETDYLVIFDNEESANKPHFRRTQLKEMRRDDLIELWGNYFTEYPGCDELTKSELIDDMMTISRRQYYADHYEQNGFNYIEEYDFSVAGYRQGEVIKVCNADYISFITYDYICNLFYDTPIHAEAEVWKREDSDAAWEFVDVFYLYEYTDIYEPSHERVYQCLLNEKNPLSHLVAYDMPKDIFENI